MKNAAVWLTNYDTGSTRSQRAYTVDSTPSHAIPWEQVGTHHGYSLEYLEPQAINQLLRLLEKGDGLAEVGEGPKPVHLKVADQPFSNEGGTRLPYHARQVSLRVQRLAYIDFVSLNIQDTCC